MEPTDVAVTILRVWLGVVMLAHGWNHGRNIEGTTNWFARIGFRNPELNARASWVGEAAIGLAMVAGFATPAAAAGIVTVMTVAFWSVHRRAGFFVFHRPDEGWEFVATMAVAAVTVATLGPGPWSLDAVFGLDRFAGWTGMAVAGAGVLAGAAQLMALWRRPD